MKLTKNLFFSAIAFAITLAILFGVVFPWLISAPSTVAVIAGLALLFGCIVGFVYWVIFKFKDKK